MSTSPSLGSPRMTTVQWLICVIAVIGFAFDIYELLMLPLILKPAIAELSKPLVDALVEGGMSQVDAMKLYQPGGEEFVKWARTLFFLPAIAGGVFGLLGGYLTDRLGRRRVLTGSILLYGFSAFAAGFATSLEMLLFFRCLVFIGVCVEFVAAVAWLAELFPDPKRRESVLGFTQAFSSVGGLMVALANKACIQWAVHLPEIHGGHEAWRYTLISGLIPAIPLIVLRPFLPESPVWQQKKLAGQLKRPSLLELFRPEFRRTTIVTAILFACGYAVAFGAIQHLPQIIPGFAEVKAEVEAAKDEAPALAKEAGKAAPTPKDLIAVGKRVEEDRAATVQSFQEVGGLIGRLLLAVLALYLVSRRQLLWFFQVPCLIVVPLTFWWMSNHMADEQALWLVMPAVFFCGLFTVGQFSFWGNYLPRMYPVHLRGTGESFAANIGGRIFGTSAAWVTLTLSAAKPPDPGKIALVAASVAAAVSVVGVIFTFWLPEPKDKEIAE